MEWPDTTLILTNLWTQQVNICVQYSSQQSQTKQFSSSTPPSLYKKQNTHKSLNLYTLKNCLNYNIKTIISILFRHQQSANEDRILACDKMYTVRLTTPTNTTQTNSSIWTDKLPHNRNRNLNFITYLHPEMNLPETNPRRQLYYAKSNGQTSTNTANYKNMPEETRKQVNKQTKELHHLSNNNKPQTNNILIKKYAILGTSLQMLSILLSNTHFSYSGWTMVQVSQDLWTTYTRPGARSTRVLRHLFFQKSL